MTDEKHDETFRVIDRRLFNEAGELRQDAIEREEKQEREKPAAKSAAASSLANEKTPPAPDTPPASAIPSSRQFQMLIDLLYSNAAVYLGGYADPATGRAMVDLDAARNIIDMFEVLRDKTRGNLAPEDDRMLVEVLGSLKMAFLEVSKAASQTVRQNPTANPTAKLRGKP